jgi:hypothetical protein
MGIASPPAAARNDKVWMVGGQLVGNYKSDAFYQAVRKWYVSEYNLAISLI